MAIDERARHQLFTKLEQTIGRAEADTLMSLLPPVGWADVATKHDLRSGLAQLEARLDARLERAMRRQLASFVAFQFTLAGLVIAAAKLL